MFSRVSPLTLSLSQGERDLLLKFGVHPRRENTDQSSSVRTLSLWERAGVREASSVKQSAAPKPEASVPPGFDGVNAN